MSGVKFHWMLQFTSVDYGCVEGDYVEPAIGECDYVDGTSAEAFFAQVFREMSPGDYLEIERVE
jgi:hypothetical protein